MAHAAKKAPHSFYRSLAFAIYVSVRFLMHFLLASWLSSGSTHFLHSSSRSLLNFTCALMLLTKACFKVALAFFQLTF